MKTKLPSILLIIITAAILINSCKEKETTDDIIILSGSVTNSDQNSNQIPDSLSCIQYLFNRESGVLVLNHINAYFNCCPDSIFIDIYQNGDTIIIEEHEAAALCDCHCYFNITIQVENIYPGQYIIKFIEPYLGNNEQLIFPIDLTQQISGSYCVNRN